MSTSPTSSTLFHLLPAFYRQRDAQIAASRTLLTAAEAAQRVALLQLPAPLSPSSQAAFDALEAKAGRGPLESLLMVLDEQLAILAENNQQLYDDLFIETCASWVVPYLGDLVGYQSLNGIAAAVASPRAEVAHTISFRRRKGTLLVLEQLGRDVTGWGAHAVEYFTLLATTQYMNHVRPQSLQTPNLRSWQVRARCNGAFDASAHTIDVRRIATGAGRYNIRNIGIFLWPVSSWPVSRVTPRMIPGAPNCFRFSTIGRDVPLYNLPVSQAADITAPATPVNVPRALSRNQLCDDLSAIAAATAGGRQPQPVYYGDGLSLALYHPGGSLIGPAGIVAANLSGADGVWQNQPVTPGTIAVDPVLGRLAIAPGTPVPALSYQYGFSAEIGGGPYSRVATFTGAKSQNVVHVTASGSMSLADAIASLNGSGIVQIDDSELYPLPGLSIAVKANGHIELRAADQQRPTLLLAAPVTITGDKGSTLDLNGLMIAYDPSFAPQPPFKLLNLPAGTTAQGYPNALSHLNLTHLTLVPGGVLFAEGTPLHEVPTPPSLHVEISSLTLSIESCILGSLVLDPTTTAAIANTVIDAADPTKTAFSGTLLNGVQQSGGTLSMTGCTVVGRIYASLLGAVSDCLIHAALDPTSPAPGQLVWLAPFWTARRQQGCIRFSYVPAGTIGPPQYECVVAGPGKPAPAFSSLTYGDPAYMRLDPSTPAAIRKGAHDGGEMGVFHALLAPLREADLRTRLSEYMPAALECGVFYQS